MELRELGKGFEEEQLELGQQLELKLEQLPKLRPELAKATKAG